MALFAVKKLDPNFKPQPHHEDWTERFSGSVTKLQVAVETGVLKIPPGGIYIRSIRLSKLAVRFANGAKKGCTFSFVESQTPFVCQGHPVYFRATTRKYHPKGLIKRQRSLSDIEAEILLEASYANLQSRARASTSTTIPEASAYASTTSLSSSHGEISESKMNSDVSVLSIVYQARV